MPKPKPNPNPNPNQDPNSGPEKSPQSMQVFGLFILVKMDTGPGDNPEVMCPKGASLLYGSVISTGDGYDPDAKEFRKMPTVGATITFEESGESVEGHYFFTGGQEYRIVHLDSVIVSFPVTDEGNP